MSRGWESKAVASQQETLLNDSSEPESQPTRSEPPDDSPAPDATSPAGPVKPASGSELQSRQRNIQADAEQKRRRQALELQRERILSERTASPHRRSALAAALASIEEELAQLGWTIHL